MMKLKAMVLGLASESVAKELAGRWTHDENSLQFWRASSNFVFVFKNRDAHYFLRFAHEQERSIDEITTELDFMQYLHDQGYPTVKPVSSKNGNLIESIQTANGTYHAVVFNQATGVSLELESMSEEQFIALGQSLGALHHLSKSFQPGAKRRKSWQDVLSFIQSVLVEHPQETEAAQELKRLEQWLQTLPCTEDQYGLIHYDFEPDNLFWKEQTANFSVIDFDDSMYHWYALDIAIVLSDLKEWEAENANRSFQAFLQGYRSITNLDEDTFAERVPKFERFADLYKFARVLRSLEDSDFENAPDWFISLKSKLLKVCAQKRAAFQRPW